MIAPALNTPTGFRRDELQRVLPRLIELQSNPHLLGADDSFLKRWPQNTSDCCSSIVLPSMPPQEIGCNGRRTCKQYSRPMATTPTFDGFTQALDEKHT